MFMNKAALKPLYRQFTPLLSALFFLVILMITSAMTLYYLNVRQLAYVQETQIPALKQQNLYIQYQLKNNTIFAQLLSERDAKQFSFLYQRLIINWQKLADFGDKGSKNTDNILLKNKILTEQVNRIAGNNSRNIQLRQQTVIQLQLVLGALLPIILNKEAQQGLLHQQILEDKVSDRVTASRARAQSHLFTELNRYHQLKYLLSNLLSMFVELDLQLPLTQFENISATADELLTLAAVVNDDFTSDIDISSMAAELNELASLLHSEQRTLAKWRGHLRLVAEFRETLLTQGLQLQALAENNPYLTSDKPAGALAVKGETDALLTIKPQQLLAIFLSVLVFSWLIFSYLLFRIRNRLKSYGSESISLCEKLINEAEVNAELITSLENSQIAALITQLKTPEHSEVEFQKAGTEYQHQLDTIAQMNNTIYWQWDEGDNLAKQMLRFKDFVLVCSSQITFDSWRQLFTRQGSKALVAGVRLAKESGQSQVIQVYTSSGKLLIVTVLYKDKRLFGTIMNAAVIDMYEQELKSLAAEQEQKRLLQQRVEQGNYRQLNQMLIPAMLQIQGNSCSSGITLQQVYRQLNRVFDWSSRQNINNQLTSEAQALSLHDVNLVNEIHAAIYNALPQARLQQNQLLLDCDPRLLAEVKLDVRLFQNLLSIVCRLLLTGVFKSVLSLSFIVKDKNLGQQKIAIIGQVFSQRKFTKLPLLLEMFSSDEDIECADNNAAFIDYLNNVFTRHYISNRSAQLTEQGYQLSFDLPLAQAKASVKMPLAAELKHVNVLLILSDKKLQAWLEQQLKALVAKVKCLTKIEDYDQALSVQQLSKTSIDLVILTQQTFELIGNDISQHISLLAGDIRPETLVLQSPFATNNHESGAYASGVGVLSRQLLVDQIKELMQVTKGEHLLDGVQVGREHRFERTEVEVLVAVTEPTRHQSLLSLLHNLGLQVHLVANPQTMLAQWQSGRFSLLLTEFQQSPFIEMVNGKSFERGVFMLPSCQMPALSVDEKNNSKGWRVEKLPTLSNSKDLAGLLVLLKPWLKEKTPEKSAVLAADKQSEQIINDYQGQFISAVEPEAVFDIQGYTNNQQTAVLAVYMLDEYLRDNRHYLAELTVAIHAQHPNQAEQKLAQLKQNAKILAAEQLFALCLELESLIGQQAWNKANVLLKDLKLSLDDIDSYAQAI